MNTLNYKGKLMSAFLLTLAIGGTFCLAVGAPFLVISYPKIAAAKTKNNVNPLALTTNSRG